MSGFYSFEVTPVEEGQRLDHFLSFRVPELSRSRIQDLISQGYIRIGSLISQPAQKVKKGMVITVTIPPAVVAKPQAQKVPFEIIYEDKDVIVVNKPAGLIVHPGAGNPDKTLVNGLLEHCGETLAGIGGVKRPGIVHRLDKGTSGLMVVAKNDQAHHFLSAQFSKRTLKRRYRALCWGVPTPLEGRIEGNIGRDPRHRQRMKVLSQGGKEAITNYKVLEKLGRHASVVLCVLETGRTHQIRVHLSYKGYGLICDPLYGKAPRGLALQDRLKLSNLCDSEGRVALHAEQLDFVHPVSNTLMTFQVAVPQDFIDLQDYLKNL